MKRRFTLRSKFIVFTLLVALLPAFAITAIQQLQSRHLAESIAVNQLATTTKHYSDQLDDTFRSMEHDARFLMETPSMAGAFQALMQPDADDENALSEPRNRWGRIGRLFGSLLIERPLYSRIELIGAADGGREFVRISRTETGIETTTLGRELRKEDIPYLSRAREPIAHGDYAATIVTEKSLEGADPGAHPALRLVFPVPDENGALLGVLVLHADLKRLLEETLARLPDGHSIAIATVAGDILEYRDQDAEPSYRSRLDSDWHESPLHDVLLEARLSGYLERLDVFSYFLRTDDSKSYDDVFDGIMVTASREALLSRSSAALSNGLLISGLLALFLAALASFLGARLAEPLGDLTRLISQNGGRLEQIPLTKTRDDEIGDLTDAFSRLSNRLIERSAFADAIFNGAADGIIAIDQTGTILTANPAAEKIFGHEASEMLGKNIDILLPAAIRHRHKRLVENVVITEDGRLMAENRDVQGLRSDGTELPLEVSISHAFSGTRKSFVGIVRDVSERRSEERHRQEMITALERSNAELDSFAYIASHDLKAPLRVIDNASRWLEEDLEQYLDDDTRESMTLLRGRIVRMERLLDDLLEHSRIGRTELAHETVPGDELMEDIIALVAPSRNFTIDVGSAFSSIRLPRMPIRNVLLNLVSNAIKHHDHPRGVVEVSVQDRGDHYEFTVSDDGPGIPPEFHERVFGMFQTLKPRDEVEGSGMGLAMVKKNIETTGGTVSLISDGERGCRFRFTWPKYWQETSELEHAA